MESCLSLTESFLIPTASVNLLFVPFLFAAVSGFVFAAPFVTMALSGFWVLLPGLLSCLGLLVADVILFVIVFAVSAIVFFVLPDFRSAFAGTESFLVESRSSVTITP